MSVSEEIAEKLKKAREDLERIRNNAWTAEEEFAKAERVYIDAKSRVRLLNLGVAKRVEEVQLWEKVLKELGQSE